MGKEKKFCLFLRRLCLEEYFLLNKSIGENEKDLIKWNVILSTEKSSNRYKVKFTSIDIKNAEDFEFKPFLFMKLPKDYHQLLNPIQFRKNYSFFNFLDYNYAINHYDDFDGFLHNTNDEKK